LRLEDHLQILSLGCGQPLKIKPWKLFEIGLFVCLSPQYLKMEPLLADHQSDGHGPLVSENHRFRTVGLGETRSHNDD